MILSPYPSGSGAGVVHENLARSIHGYETWPYSPRWEYAPWALAGRGRLLARPELIHAPADHAICFSRRSVPLVATFHGYVLDGGVDDYSSALQRLHYRTDLRWLTRKSVRVASAITAVSRFTASLVQSDLNCSRDIQVIYNGVDETRFTPAQPRSRRRIKVLYAGKLTRRKGAHWLKPVAERLPGHIKLYYTSGLRGTGVRDTMVGSSAEPLRPVPHAEMHRVYQAMDILFFPSVREGFGLVAAEAMACGLPVVANDVSAIPELVTNGMGGILCEVGDTQAYVDAIVSLADSPQARLEMGQFNRARIEKEFTLARMVEEYKALFDRLLSSSAG